ncbi:monoacylglycerol O-acyltransferase 2, isoform CRA_b [Mus musculus]|nr:monoacylglycerol O-acyltransferase 2, isoform CRA_b [Mus musculus]
MGAQATDLRGPSVGLLLPGLGPALHRHLRRPPIHKVLALLCPVCHLVVPGLGQAAAGRPAHPVLQTLGHMEVHEGLFPCLSELRGLQRDWWTSPTLLFFLLATCNKSVRQALPPPC